VQVLVTHKPHSKRQSLSRRMLTLLLLQLHDGHESNLDRLIAIYYCHAIAENCMPGARVVFATLFSIFSISFSLAGKRVGWWVVGEVVVEKLEKEEAPAARRCSAPYPSAKLSHSARPTKRELWWCLRYYWGGRK